MSSKLTYFAHEGVDHSTGATHAGSNETVNSVSVFIAISIAAALLLAGALMLIKRYVQSKGKK